MTPVGTTLVIRFTESKTRNEVTGVILLDLGLQRLLHPPRALESVSRMGGEVSSSVFVTLGPVSSPEREQPLCSTPECVCLLRLPSSSSLWGSCQLKQSCCFAPPQSASVFVCFCLRLSPSSPAYVFVCLRRHLAPSSTVSVVVPR